MEVVDANGFPASKQRFISILGGKLYHEYSTHFGLKNAE